MFLANAGHGCFASRANYKRVVEKNTNSNKSGILVERRSATQVLFLKINQLILMRSFGGKNSVSKHLNYFTLPIFFNQV